MTSMTRSKQEFLWKWISGIFSKNVSKGNLAEEKCQSATWQVWLIVKKKFYENEYYLRCVSVKCCYHGNVP